MLVVSLKKAPYGHLKMNMAKLAASAARHDGKLLDGRLERLLHGTSDAPYAPSEARRKFTEFVEI